MSALRSFPTVLLDTDSVDAMQQFEDLVGRAPDIQPLLKRRGLLRVDIGEG